MGYDIESQIDNPPDIKTRLQPRCGRSRRKLRRGPRNFSSQELIHLFSTQFTSGDSKTNIQSWSEVPSIAHFCSLFRAAFNLLDFDIEELEEALLTDGAEDAGSSLLQELIVRLLCGCVQSNEISTFNYQMFLRRLFRQKCHEYGRENPFNTDIDFQFLPLRTKVEILHALCDFRLDADDVQDLLKNLESDSLRVEPLGHDENKSAYWYFYGTRLYREDFPKNKKKIQDKRRKSKEEKRKRKRCKTSYESDIEDDIAPGVWQVVCYTEEDWEKLAMKFKGSTCKDEKDLHRTLTEDFLPEIPRLFAEKERLQKKRMMEYQPRRQSSRLEKLKQKEEEEKILAREEEEKLRLEKEERDRRDRLMARTVRAFQRASSRSGSECGSYRSEREREADDAAVPDESHQLLIGRQTNNSLASATGQIIIQPPRRKKLRSKQVYKTSAEDLRTGMYKILEYIKNHEEAWPFVDPVDENYAPRYYSVIRKPMDLQRMEDKLDSGEYLTFNDFRNDFQLIVDNCRQYNGSENEYTEMVRNLQEAFREAVDRYLESDPSSDEEVAVEFPPAFGNQKVKEHGRKKRKLKRKEKDQIKDKENKKKKYESDDSESKPPSLKPQRIRSPLSEKSGSIPGSDFDDREPDFLREHSPPQLIKGTEMDMTEDSSTDSRTKLLPKPKTEKPRKGTGVIKNVAAIEALSLATEQTLKDINKWLDDTPRFSEFSSASNSPSHFLSSEEFENGGSRLESESKKTFKTERSRMKDKDTVKKKKNNMDLMKPRRKEVQRTIERLQPGKSKGNLITNLTKTKENVEESGLSLGMGLGKLIKESRNALLVKTDETAPKLSLGTVLKNDIIGFGKNKHNFDEKEGLKKDVLDDIENEMSDKSDIPKGSVNSAGFDYVAKRSPERKLDAKSEEYSKDKENDYLDKGKGDEVKSQVPEEKKRVAVKEITNKNKPTPNLSAWFKAFGAPKAPSTPKRKPEANEPPPTLGRTSTSPSQESRSELAFKPGGDGKEKNERTWYQESFKNSPSSGTGNKDRIEAPPSVESEEPKSVSVASPMPSPDIRPGSASSLVQPLSNLPPAPRQRKASTSSSMSERSSFSQDPMDGSSPHLSMDERLGGYPAPYPSPLHRSPVAASPILASPKGEDISKSGYASINGTIRVGFYQDTSSNFQKSSPEKQSPNSNSPRDQGNSSPFQSYSSPHVYPPSVSQSGNMSNIYCGQTTHSATANYSSYPSGTSANPPGLYDNLSQYSLSSMMNYADASFRTTKPQDNYNFSPRPPSYSNPEATSKPPSSVFPVKKRLYAEIEAGRLQIPNESPKMMEQRGLMQSSPQGDPTANRNLYSDARDGSALPFSSLQQPDMHLQSQAQQYERYPPQPGRIHQGPDIARYPTSDGSNRLTSDLSKPTNEQDGKDANAASQPLPYSVDAGGAAQGGEVENLSRFHPEIPRLQLPTDYSKLQQNDVTKMLSDPGGLPGEMNNMGKAKYGMPSPDNSRGLGNLMDNIGRLQPQGMANSAAAANRGCYSNPMEAAGLGRLLQPPGGKNAITEDSDGVFRNKYPSQMEGIGKLQQPQQNFPGQDEGKLGYGSSAALGRMSAAGGSPESRTPCTGSYQSPMDASLRQNLSNLSHIVDRYQAEERLMQQSAFFSDKNLANIYSKSVSSCGAMYSQSGLGKVTNPSVSTHSQVSYSRESDLNIPKSGNFSDGKKNRKKPGKSGEVGNGTSGSAAGNTAFQQYVGLKSNEPAAISLKTASVVPGSAFNFGPAPTGLGLPNSLYSEKDAYGGFLDDFRSQPSTYYSMVAAAAHHRSTPDPSAEKTSHSSGSGNAFPFLGHPQTRPSGYPALPQFVNPHQAGLMDPGAASSPLYQQYIQRLQEEQLRHSGVLHQGLLGPSSGYPSGYHHPALGIPRQSYDRPSWL